VSFVKLKEQKKLLHFTQRIPIFLLIQAALRILAKAPCFHHYQSKCIAIAADNIPVQAANTKGTDTPLSTHVA